MNRRLFITGVFSSFFILPSATTYAREWIKIGKLHTTLPLYITAKDFYSIYWNGEITVSRKTIPGNINFKVDSCNGLHVTDDYDKLVLSTSSNDIMPTLKACDLEGCLI